MKFFEFVKALSAVEYEASMPRQIRKSRENNDRR